MLRLVERGRVPVRRADAERRADAAAARARRHGVPGRRGRRAPARRADAGDRPAGGAGVAAGSASGRTACRRVNGFIGKLTERLLCQYVKRDLIVKEILFLILLRTGAITVGGRGEIC